MLKLPQAYGPDRTDQRAAVPINGVTTAYSYDAADRLRGLRTTLGVVDLSRFQYTVDRIGQRTVVTETVATPPLSLPSTRVISYTYDGLRRLTGASESPGSTYAYGYDLAGNRTSITVNGNTTTTSYDAANQVSGWSYDNAGNLTNDGTTTYTYDALSRMTGRGATSYTYNGDGVLVYDGTTRYTQDLAAPLSQVLQTIQGSTTTNYLYGLERLAAVTGGIRTWYGSDALGSVRQTLSDAATPLGIVNYDPWGTPESGSVPTFGFTGELQDTASGLVNLRARWYQTGQGRFMTRDSWLGDNTRPYSLHPYQYGYSNPVLWIDPTGKCATDRSADAVCWQTLAKAVDTLGFTPARLDTWSTASLNYLLTWSEHIKFTPTTDESIQWTAENINSVLTALQRIDRATNSRAKAILGLDQGDKLTLVKEDGTRGIGGEYAPETSGFLGRKYKDYNTIKLLLPSTPFYNYEWAVDTAIHEFGHRADHIAGQAIGASYYWSFECEDWAKAAGWNREYYTYWLFWTYGYNTSISEKGRQGAIRNHSMTLSTEDFADTFAWYVEQVAGNKVYELAQAPGQQNRSNTYGGAPNPERVAAMKKVLGIP